MPHYHHPSSHHRGSRPSRSLPVRILKAVWHFLTRPFRIIYRLLKGKRTRKEMLKLITLSFLSFLAFCVLAGFGTIAYFSRDLPDPEKLIDRHVAQSTKIYDRTGEHLLYEISTDQKRTIIRMEDLPPFVPQAVIALEDKTFYEHSGFNFRRLVKAVLYKMVGRSGPGASTLTSQLVKNAILSPEKTIGRKLREMILVFQIERKFSKDEILQLYLNEIPYGGTAYGIEAASNLYFGISAKDLNLAQAALLAAIIQRPSYFKPTGTNVDKLLQRKDVTLRLMAEQGYITEEEREAAAAIQLTFKERREDITAPHFVFYVREQLEEKYGVHLVNQGGLIVKTTLDLDKQNAADEIIKSRVEANKQFNASNAALVSLDVKTGEILAMVGSIDYFNDDVDGQVNVVTRPRQPGSSFKPIVYTLAWQRGYTPSTVLFDVEADFPGSGQVYHPKNYDLKEHGPVSLRKALQGSLNVPAVKLLYLLGVSNVLDFATDLGYTTLGDRSRFGLSLVLGGGEVTLLDHTAAYATFAAEGNYHEPLAILEVKTTDGHVLDTFTPKERRVLDSNIANITSNVLSDNAARAYAFGLNNGLTLPDRQAAAKTGTTNDYRDAWTMGYTPQYATGVWVGNNDFSEMKRGGGSSLAAPIWQAYMRKAHEGVPAQSFTAAKIPVPDKAVLSGISFGVTQVTVDKASGKLATDLTPSSFREERLYVDAHDILHYVDKRNPTGPAPANPEANDPQYKVWEATVQAWIAKRVENNEPIFDLKDQTFPEGIQIVQGLPPSDADDLHVPGNQPRLSIISPIANASLSQRSIMATVDANAPRGIARVEFYIDDILLGTDSSYPYEVNASLKSLSNGFYFLKAIAYDDIDNTAQENLRFQLQSNESFVDMSWVEPENRSQIEKPSTPLTLKFRIESPERLNQITFFAEFTNTHEETLIEAIIGSQTGIISTQWQPTKAGTYRLYPKISLEGSGVLTGPSLTIQIAEPATPPTTATPTP